MTNVFEIIKDFPFELNPEEIIQSLGLTARKPQIISTIKEYTEKVLPVAKPKALYKVAYIDHKLPDSLEIDGVKFTSRILRINLDKVERVFPYIVTCGNELEGSFREVDILGSFCLDIIKNNIIKSTVSYLSNYINEHYKLAGASHMNPGSLKDWPLKEQKQLFSLFGNVEEAIGVKLTESCIMYPLKSASGIYFPTEVTFQSCQLCPRQKCVGRRAPFSVEKVKIYNKTMID
jgi:hypothetical protein